MGYFNSIDLINFRNFENYSLNFSKNCNVFYGKNGWTSEFDEAIKIPRNEIEFYEDKCKIYEDNCIIISPTFIEIDENGDVLNLRDKIRINGITIEI